MTAHDVNFLTKSYKIKKQGIVQRVTPDIPPNITLLEIICDGPVCFRKSAFISSYFCTRGTCDSAAFVIEAEFIIFYLINSLVEVLGKWTF